MNECSSSLICLGTLNISMLHCKLHWSEVQQYFFCYSIASKRKTEYLELYSFIVYKSCFSLSYRKCFKLINSVCLTHKRQLINQQIIQEGKKKPTLQNKSALNRTWSNLENVVCAFFDFNIDPFNNNNSTLRQSKHVQVSMCASICVNFMGFLLHLSWTLWAILCLNCSKLNKETNWK